jgi:hypothetical protein
MPAIVYLASIFDLYKNLKQSPFIAFCKLIKILKLDPRIFFEQFQEKFQSGMKKKSYINSDIHPLLDLLSRGDEKLFSKYLEIFSSNVSPHMNYGICFSTYAHFIILMSASRNILVLY